MQNIDILNSLISSLQTLLIALTAQVAAMPITPPQTQETPAPIAAKVTQHTSTTSQTTSSNVSFTAINNLYSDAVVNILCKGSGKFKSGTATGVVISPTGMILTNAHMAQYMLLEQASTAPIRCTIRIGSPAKDTYKATVLYMPPSWVERNAYQIANNVQRATGEDDYALLQITKSLDDSRPLPNQFTHLAPNASFLATKKGQNVLARAYPAEFLSSRTALNSLKPISTVTQLGQIATFNNTGDTEISTPDLISLGGTIVAQGGSSGGAVINNNAELIGLIVTSTRKAETKDRNLKAITLSHINTSIKKHTSRGIAELITIPPSILLKEFEKDLLNTTQAFVDVYNK